MTSARIQPFCKKRIINIEFFNGKEITPRIINQRKISLFIYNIQFCLIWISNDVGFNRAIEELKLNFKVIDNVISDKHVKSFVKYEYKPKKVQSP